MLKLVISINFFLLLISSDLFAETQNNEIDPVVVSSNKYKVVLENDHVRVVEYDIPVGQKDNWHTHPAKVSHVISGGTLRITTDTDESFLVEEETGSTTWFQAVGLHYAENVGETSVRIVFVEIKQSESDREDINKYRRNKNEE
jgi:quercetin dioxygenase-like cupin family protein